LPNQNFRVKNGLEVGAGATISPSGNITAGIITATSLNGAIVGGGISATGLRVTGVTTFNGAVNVRNGYNLNIGDNDDLRIYNDGSNSYIEDTGAGSLNIFGSDIDFKQHSTNKTFARLVGGGAAELYYNDNKKFSTSGVGVTVTGTLVTDQVNSSGVVTATKFVKTGATASNFLKANGDDSALLSSDVTGALGYTPANSASVSGQYPVGNSIILDNFSSSFNGSDTDFTLASVGVAFTPTGSSANLVVSVGGVIQKPGTDYSIVQVGGGNTNTIRFTTAPSSGLDCFVVGLGGQGALLSDVSWNAKGDMVVATGDNVASILSVGSNNSVLIADSSAANGVRWGNIDTSSIVSGLSSISIVSASSTISAYFNGSNVFNVVGTGVTMVAGQRLDVSAYSETVQTLGSSGSPISGTNALNIGTYSTFIAYVGTSSVTFTLTGAVSSRLSSWTLILIYTNSGSRNVSFSFGTLRYAGGSSSVTLSSTAVHDVLSFFTADGATNTYASVVGLGFAT